MKVNTPKRLGTTTARTTVQTVALLTMVAALAGCGGGSKQPAHFYPAAYEHGFVGACQRVGRDHTYCRCALDYIEAHESYADASAVGFGVSAKDKVVVAAQHACAGS